MTSSKVVGAVFVMLVAFVAFSEGETLPWFTGWARRCRRARPPARGVALLWPRVAPCPLAGMSLRSLGVEQHCRCIQTESKIILRYIEKVELITANSHCDEAEIM